jgi:hypothetical protein
MSSLKRSRIRFAAFLSMMTALAVTVRPSAPIHQGPLSPDFLSASSAPDWNFRKILADIEAAHPVGWRPEPINPLE